ncbi:hypothetical protein JG688_00017404 [Phytophthora aleatoria]|uniref:Uncharacterized protein n=1 Tax=Phytophthora aleatoria TaxID=2496075 RepID=A0A8J5I1J8_9STRA|nr:hypothetical protein JG688_00017404 [Phytophthora aleatoria]
MVLPAKPASDTSAYVSQSTPETLRDTIEYEQRFEGARKLTCQNQSHNTTAKTSPRNDGRTGSGRGRTHGSDSITPAALKSAPAANSSSSTTFVPTDHKCGVLGQKVADYPSRGTGTTPKI